MISGFILSSIWGFIYNLILQFWIWLVGAGVALLGFMFSSTIRKYSIGLIIVSLLIAAVFIWGYNSNQIVTTITHSCDEFRKVLVQGPATDKAIRIFIKHGLCL